MLSYSSLEFCVSYVCHLHGNSYYYDLIHGAEIPDISFIITVYVGS